MEASLIYFHSIRKKKVNLQGILRENIFGNERKYKSPFYSKQQQQQCTAASSNEIHFANEFNLLLLR